MEEIDQRARARAIEREFAALQDLQQRPGAKWAYVVERGFIRGLRVLCGLALGLASLLLIGNAPSVSDTPFAALTLGMLAGSLASWAFAALFAWWALLCAFGAAPTAAEIEGKLRQQATKTADVRAANLGGRYE